MAFGTSIQYDEILKKKNDEAGVFFRAFLINYNKSNKKSIGLLIRWAMVCREGT